MRLLAVLPVTLYIMSFVFLVVCVGSSSRPHKAVRRGIEFGLYLLATSALTYFNVPSSTAFMTLPPEHLDNLSVALAAVKTMILSVMFVRLGIILLRGYGQREALRKYLAKRETDD